MTPATAVPLLLGLALLSPSPDTTSEITVDDRTYAWTIVGDYGSVATGNSVSNGRLELSVILDGAEHKFRADGNKLTYNGKSKTVPDYKRVELRFDKAKGEVRVDGELVFPDPAKPKGR